MSYEVQAKRKSERLCRPSAIMQNIIDNLDVSSYGCQSRLSALISLKNLKMQKSHIPKIVKIKKEPLLINNSHLGELFTCPYTKESCHFCSTVKHALYSHLAQRHIQYFEKIPAEADIHEYYTKHIGVNLTHKTYTCNVGQCGFETKYFSSIRVHLTRLHKPNQIKEEASLVYSIEGNVCHADLKPCTSITNIHVNVHKISSDKKTQNNIYSCKTKTKKLKEWSLSSNNNFNVVNKKSKRTNLTSNDCFSLPRVKYVSRARMINENVTRYPLARFSLPNTNILLQNIPILDHFNINYDISNINYNDINNNSILTLSALPQWEKTKIEQEWEKENEGYLLDETPVINLAPQHPYINNKRVNSFHLPNKTSNSMPFKHNNHSSTINDSNHTVIRASTDDLYLKRPIITRAPKLKERRSHIAQPSVRNKPLTKIFGPQIVSKISNGIKMKYDCSDNNNNNNNNNVKIGFVSKNNKCNNLMVPPDPIIEPGAIIRTKDEQSHVISSIPSSITNSIESQLITDKRPSYVQNYKETVSEEVGPTQNATIKYKKKRLIGRNKSKLVKRARLDKIKNNFLTSVKQQDSKLGSDNSINPNFLNVIHKEVLQRTSKAIDDENDCIQDIVHKSPDIETNEKNLLVLQNKYIPGHVINGSNHTSSNIIGAPISYVPENITKIISNYDSCSQTPYIENSAIEILTNNKLPSSNRDNNNNTKINNFSNDNNAQSLIQNSCSDQSPVHPKKSALDINNRNYCSEMISPKSAIIPISSHHCGLALRALFKNNSGSPMPLNIGSPPSFNTRDEKATFIDKVVKSDYLKPINGMKRYPLRSRETVKTVCNGI